MISTVCSAALAFALMLPTDIRAQSTPLSFDPRRTNQLDFRPLKEGAVEIVTRGEDPYILLQPFSPSAVPKDHTVLEFEYFSAQGVDGLTIYYGPPITAGRSFPAGSMVRAESWMPFSIDLKSLSGGKWTRENNQIRMDPGRKPGVTLRIRNLHLRPPSAEELSSHEERENERRSKLARQERINTYYLTGFRSRIDSVEVKPRQLVITGEKPAGDRELHLLEIRPWVSIAGKTTMENETFILTPQDGVIDAGPLPESDRFQTTIQRFENATDRITSRWAVAELLADRRWMLNSHWHYSSDLHHASRHKLKRREAKSLKGMGGVSSRFPLDELVELGVHHITVNLNLSALINSTPHSEWPVFNYGGRRWFVNQRLLSEYDTLIEFAHQHEIVVSGVLLLPFSSTQFGKAIIHPEADRAGHYAMPNFTEARGVAAYEAAIAFLSQRYAHPGNPHGRISNWIVHNEINFGWEWTNMGKQPAMLYMDTYLRSMRLVHDITRRNNPHSRVFISLTHHWNVKNDPSWKSHSPRDLVLRLVESSRLEGDFAWGIAYHPYPQNLRKPDAWNDTRTRDDFETELITPKNIAVLDRWMQQPKMLYQGKHPRAVLLSEQGFNTPDYSEESQRLQAAGFVYMWRQMRGLESIEAFHNHRWVDHPREGGLHLGLRKLPAKGKSYGVKKFAWEVYKALGTPEEKEASHFADEIIGSSPEP